MAQKINKVQGHSKPLSKLAVGRRLRERGPMSQVGQDPPHLHPPLRIDRPSRFGVLKKWHAEPDT